MNHRVTLSVPAKGISPGERLDALLSTLSPLIGQTEFRISVTAVNDELLLKTEFTHVTTHEDDPVEARSVEAAQATSDQTDDREISWLLCINHGRLSSSERKRRRRIATALADAGIEHVADLTRRTVQDLRTIKGIGETSAQFIEEKLAYHGLSLQAS